MKENENEEYVGVRVPKRMKEWLRQRALSEGTTMSELVREILNKEVRTWTLK